MRSRPSFKGETEIKAITKAIQKPRYSPEIILRYREMERAGEFKREVKERVPSDLDFDELTLSCGHKKEMNVYQISAMDGTVTCNECRKEWLAKAVEEERRSGK